MNGPTDLREVYEQCNWENKEIFIRETPLLPEYDNSPQVIQEELRNEYGKMIKVWQEREGRFDIVLKEVNEIKEKTGENNQNLVLFYAEGWQLAVFEKEK